MLFSAGSEAIFHSHVWESVDSRGLGGTDATLASALWSHLRALSSFPWQAFRLPVWNMFLLSVTSPLRDTGVLQLEVLQGL